MSMDKREKSEGQRLVDKLFINLKNSWEEIDAETENKVEEFATNYKYFLDNGKTERECVEIICGFLEKNDFLNIESLRENKFKPGMKIYQNIRGKALLAAVIGKKPVVEGCNIIGSHIDAPRLDLKQNPLYEEDDLALFDTHYYGGIKKYQWTAIPLSMHGVFVNENGRKTAIRIGEELGDPVFTITDLLPHLSKEQMEKKASEAVEGENLDILVGSRPFSDNEVNEKVKLRILSLLHDKYAITEKNFASAEIEFVPAFKACDIGLDRSLIGGYGHDDRSCTFSALKAIVNIACGRSVPEKTIICYFSDKEEIGSVGNTSAQSLNLENFITSICLNKEALNICFSRSAMLSADVNAAFDPAYSEVFDKKNASHIGKGIVLTKYTGSGGKRGANDANAEFCAKVQSIMSRNNIQWQFGELGKVDKGGGGTIALYLANSCLEVMDCGIPVLSMHSPFEVISKIDLYMMCRGFVAFFLDN